MIDRFRSSGRVVERMAVIHFTRNDIANTHGFQRGLMRRASDKRAHRRAACEERVEDCFTRFAAAP